MFLDCGTQRKIAHPIKSPNNNFNQPILSTKHLILMVCAFCFVISSNQFRRNLYLCNQALPPYFTHRQSNTFPSYYVLHITIEYTQPYCVSLHRLRCDYIFIDEGRKHLNQPLTDASKSKSPVFRGFFHCLITIH